MTTPAALTPPATPRSRRRQAASLWLGAALVALVVLAAVVSVFWTPHNPTAMNPTDRLAAPNAEYWFGTDKFGRDTFSQILVGARTTLFVGVVAVGVSALVGVPLGLLAAMGPPRLGRALMRAGDVMLAFPAILLAVMFAAVFGGSTLTAMVAIGLAGIPAFMRVVRGTALRVLASEYIQAARVAGRSTLRIAFTHVLPGVRGIVIVQASVAFAMAILAEAALSFLGLGTPPPDPSWGRMLQESQELLFTDVRLAYVPAAAIAVSVLGFNLLGDGLRDLLDPKLRELR